jgi:hypothetical protein
MSFHSKSDMSSAQNRRASGGACEDQRFDQVFFECSLGRESGLPDLVESRPHIRAHAFDRSFREVEQSAALLRTGELA